MADKDDDAFEIERPGSDAASSRPRSIRCAGPTLRLRPEASPRALLQ